MRSVVATKTPNVRTPHRRKVSQQSLAVARVKAFVAIVAIHAPRRTCDARGRPQLMQESLRVSDWPLEEKRRMASLGARLGDCNGAAIYGQNDVSAFLLEHKHCVRDRHHNGPSHRDILAHFNATQLQGELTTNFRTIEAEKNVARKK